MAHQLAQIAFSASLALGLVPMTANALEPLLIAASPRLAKPLEALAEAFEAAHPQVRIKILYDSGLGLRGNIARLQNTGQYSVGSGLIHIVAPGDQELIDRLEHRYYVLPGTRREYAAARLALVVAKGDGAVPASLEDLVRHSTKRLVVADPEVSELGHRARAALEQVGWTDLSRQRLVIAHDAPGVIDRLANGKADVGLLFAHQAVEAGDQVKVVALLPGEVAPPGVYAMTMDRFCPNRPLCEEFLDFSLSPEARVILARLGYGVPPGSDPHGVNGTGPDGTAGSDHMQTAARSSSWLSWVGGIFGHEQ